MNIEEIKKELEKNFKSFSIYVNSEKDIIMFDDLKKILILPIEIFLKDNNNEIFTIIKLFERDQKIINEIIEFLEKSNLKFFIVKPFRR